MTADELVETDRRLTAAASGGFLDSDPVVRLLASMVDGTDDPVEPSWSQRQAFVAAVEAGRSTSPRRIGRRLVPAVLFGGSLLLGGAAAAATGSLPDPIQDVAHELADVVGIHVPEGDEATTDLPVDAGGVDGVGADGTPPGHGGIVPGTGDEGGGNGVGADGTPPGHGGTVPGTGDETGGDGAGTEPTVPPRAVVPEDPGSEGGPPPTLPEPAETEPTHPAPPTSATPSTPVQGSSADEREQGRRASRDG